MAASEKGLRHIRDKWKMLILMVIVTAFFIFIIGIFPTFFQWPDEVLFLWFLLVLSIFPLYAVIFFISIKDYKKNYKVIKKKLRINKRELQQIKRRNLMILWVLCSVLIVFYFIMAYTLWDFKPFFIYLGIFCYVVLMLFCYLLVSLPPVMKI